MDLVQDLRWQDWEKFRKGSSPEVLWQAVETLVHHLDHHLVLVDEQSFPSFDFPKTPARLTVFQAKDVNKTPLYALATTAGHIIVGRCDKLSLYQPLELADFDPLWDEVLSLAVTDEHRGLGDHLDLWVIVRRYKGKTPKSVVYHGVVWLKDGHLPSLRPAQDDLELKDPQRWQAQPASRFPEWLRKYPLSFSLDVDPFSDFPQIKVREDPLDVTTMAWTGSNLCYACGDELRLMGERPMPLALWESAKGLALVNDPTGRICGVVGCDDCRLVAFETRQDEIQVAWYQEQSDFPLALAFLPQDPKGEDWPDLLVADQGGRLQRLRYVGSRAIRDAWDACWNKLGLSEPNERIRAAQKSVGGPSWDRRLATLWGAVESVLATVVTSQPEQQENWLEELSALFRAKPQETRSIRRALRYLLSKLRFFAEGKEPPRAFQNGDFLPALVLRIYQKHLAISDRERVDRSIRLTNWTESVANDPAVKKLHERAKRTPDRVWRGIEPSSTPSRTESIERAYLGLGRWANGYVAVAYHHFRQEEIPGCPLLSLSSLTIRHKPWLLTLGQEGPALHAAATDSAVDLELGFGSASRPTQDSLTAGQVQAVVPIPGEESDLVLLVDDRGRFHVLEANPDNGLRPLALPTEAYSGRSWLLASCAHRKGGSLLLATANQGRRTSLLIGRLVGEELRFQAPQVLDLPRVTALDLAPDPQSGYRLVVSSFLAAPVYLIRLDEGGRILEQRPLRSMESGTSAIRLNEDGTQVLVGERNGLLWCLDLDNAGDLRWTYRMSSAVRAIARTRVEDVPHFLVGAETCTLNLLRAEDGRRSWRERLPQAIRQLVVLDDGKIVVGMSQGLVTIYKQLSKEERRQALEEVRIKLQDLTSAHPHIRQETNAPQVEVFFRFLQGGEEILGLIRGFKERKTRVRLLRYMVKELNFFPPQAEEIVKELSFRELAYLLAYLPDEKTQWDRLIWARLRLPPREEGGEQAVPSRAAEVAMAAFLKRRGKEQPSVAELIDDPPAANYFNLPWVRISFTSLLVQAIRREMKRADAPDQAFFPRLVSALLRFSPELARSAFLAFAENSEVALDGKAFAAFLSGLKRDGPLLNSGGYLKRLTERLCQQTKPAGWLRLLCSFVALEHARFRLDQARSREIPSPWSSIRQDGLTALRAMTEASHAFDAAKAPEVTGLIEGLRSLLPRQPLVPDRETLEEREQAVERSLRQLERFREKTWTRVSNHPWWPYIANLLKKTEETAREFYKAELTHVRRQVRPRLSLLSQHLDDNNRLSLRIRMEGEGWRHLEDVSIQVNAGGPNGLLPPGQLEDRLAVLVYPGRFADQDMEFFGYLRPGQGSVGLVVSIQDGEGYKLEETWTFPVPEPPSNRAGALTLPGALPKAYEYYRRTLFAVQDSVSLVVFDPELGRDALLAAWDQQFPGRRLDLDGATRDTGPGRRYGERRLDLPLIEAAIAEIEDRTSPGSRQSALLFAPVDEFIQRLLDGEAPNLLEAWWTSLQARARRRDTPPWLVLVSSAHACRLRRLGLDSIPERPAHRLPDAWVRDELQALVMTEAKLKEPEAIRCLERLGMDLRLVLGWLRWLSKTPESRALEGYLEQKEVGERIRAELRSLPAFDLINALLGAETETTLRLAEVIPGQMAAQDYDSTTRKSTSHPKRLCSRGEVLTAEDLNRLHSDSRPPTHLRVQGIGTRGTAEASRSQLLEMAQYPRLEEREASLQRLAERGIGTWKGGIFCTSSPFRELIQALYDRYRLARYPGERDREVYVNLLGEGHSPAEAIAPLEVARISEDQLARLMPAAPKSDRQCLRRLARLWGTSPEERREDLILALRELFPQESVERLGPEECDGPLFGFDFPGYAVRQPHASHPHSYLFWIETDVADPTGRLGEALSQIMACRKQDPDSGHRPRLLLLGPGAERLPMDPTRRVAVLPLSAFCQAAWEGDLAGGVQRKARAQLRLSAFSPFQTSGPLPPGSPLFQGRDDELEFIQSRLRRSNILVVGGRRIGKTSLLKQVYHWARQEPDLAPIFLDLQGVDTARGFLQALALELKDGSLGQFSTENPREQMRVLAQRFRDQGRLLVLLLNEIDALVEQDRTFIEILRGLADEGLAHYVMIGYVVIGQLATLGAPDSPLFHFTEGTHFGGKAVALYALSKPAAENLLDLLEKSELQLRWETVEQKRAAYQGLLERSYRVPWVLQRYGQLLVEHLERERRDVLRWDDVEHVLKREGDVVWQYIDSIGYGTLGYRGQAQVLRPGFELVLHALVRSRYLLGGPKAPIRDRQLRERSALDLGFTVAEARDMVDHTMGQILLGRERDAFRRWFAELDLEQALRLLTLTLALEPDPNQHDRFAFLLHIYPLELYRRFGAEDPLLDDKILEWGIKFISSMEHNQE